MKKGAGMNEPVSQNGFLALEDVANSLGEVRKVIDLIALAAEATDPISTLALPGISATAAMAGERMDDMIERLYAIVERWRGLSPAP